MSDFYDYNHRCETLAEFNFYFGDDSEESVDNDDNYIYCYCSRVFIRDGIKTYFIEKEYVSESDAEVIQSHSQECEDQSHVHFSVDTSYKVKCEKDEGASCYCSASHTENCCSTDEHDIAHVHGTSHALQPSDSGADLTYQDYHSDTHEKVERMELDFPNILTITEHSEITNENYLSEVTWEKFWAVNGERLIWASWIKKYSDYINPAYLDDDNGLSMDENNIPKQHSVDQIYKKSELIQKITEDDEIRERKFSYDSKVNPYKKIRNQNQQERIDKSNEANKDDIWLPIGRKRSCSEHERILSPRTIAGTDSMTNVTKLTASSYDVASSQVTSDSTPTDEYSDPVSSTSSDDPSNDHTRIANDIDVVEQIPSEEDTEQYWQLLWKKHFGEQYALHYASYLEKNNTQETKMPDINIEVIQQEKIKEKLEIECENSEGTSQETPTVIEIQNQVDQITLDDNKPKKKKRNKKANRYMSSVGVLLQNLLKEEANKENEPKDAGDENKDSDAQKPQTADAVDGSTESVQQPQGSNHSACNCNEGDDEPPEETFLPLKRSHELDEDGNEDIAFQKIKNTFQIMGFCVQPEKLPKGELIYRKRLFRLRPPRQKRFGTSKKTYFDEDGNPYSNLNEDSQDDKDMQTDEDCTEVKSEAVITKNDSGTDKAGGYELTKIPSLDDDKADPIDVPLPDDDSVEEQENKQNIEEAAENKVSEQVESRRRRRPKKYAKLDEAFDTSDMPEELKNDPKMYKYWKKRHSLFHRFDEGIKLDRESWFSVTPESVASHIANKYVYDTVLDAFCGAGGNTIQFAHVAKKVIAIDIDPIKIEMAKHNATVYGVADRIEFIIGDFFELAPNLKADMVFLSPPWGGPSYADNQEYDLESMLQPKPASELMKVARTISPTISLYVPRNSRPDQILCLAKEVGGSVEIEQSFLDRRFVAITAYFY